MNQEPEVFTIQEAGAFLRMCESLVRRIPFTELPYAKPGLRRLYLREDLLAYMRAQREKVRTLKTEAA